MIKALVKLLVSFLPRSSSTILYREIRRIRRSPNFEAEQEYYDFFQKAFRALAFNQISGDYLEFGCYGANTFTTAFRESRRAGCHPKLWAFDSFKGLPQQNHPADAHPVWIHEHLSMSAEQFIAVCKKNRIPPTEYRIVEGYYEESLTSAALEKDGPTDICLAYIDCDLYSSTVTVLKFLTPRLKHGMILAFDDYHCWSATQPAGERRALFEAFSDHPVWRLVPFLNIGWAGMSFAVEDKRLLPKALPPTM